MHPISGDDANLRGQLGVDNLTRSSPHNFRNLGSLTHIAVCRVLRSAILTRCQYAFLLAAADFETTFGQSRQSEN